MTVTSLDELKQAQRSCALTRLVVRPRGGVTHTLTDVVVTGVTDDEVTVSDHRGDVRTFALDTLVDVDAEDQQRRRMRGVGWFFDILGLFR